MLITPTLKLYEISTATGSCAVFVDQGEIVEAGPSLAHLIKSSPQPLFKRIEAAGGTVRAIPITGIVIREFVRAG